MMRSFIVGLVGVLGAFGQELSLLSGSWLSATGNGERLHFISFASLPDEARVAPYRRIFRMAATPVPVRFEVGNRILSSPFLSSDGETEGVFAETPCSGSCMIARPSHYLKLTRKGQDFEFFGNGLRISRNGRFVYDAGFPSLHPGPRIFDLDSGDVLRMPSLLTWSIRHAVSDTGAVLSTDIVSIPGVGEPSAYRKVLVTPYGGASKLLFEGEGILGATLSPSGEYVFLARRLEAGGFALLQFDMGKGSQSTVWEGDQAPRSLETSADGSKLLLGLTDELLLWERGMGWRHLLSHSEGFGEVLMSDDGHSVFVTTRSNRFLRLDVGSSEVKELLAPLPARLDQISGGAYPGSLIRFESSNRLPEAHEYSLQAGNWKFPMIDSESPNLDFQIPWEALELVGRGEIAELSVSGSPMVLRVRASFASRIQPWAFTFTPRSPNDGPQRHLLVSANADFSKRIDLENPARPGELIHFWLTGLGPLERSLQTGEKGPVNPVARPLTEIACYLRASDGFTVRGLEVPTVIYAPGLVGVYQIDAILPVDWPEGVSVLECRTNEPGRSFGEIPIQR
jgi:uncharacterized protein (TIGR03437 family)